jgi:hypothetical protein
MLGGEVYTTLFMVPDVISEDDGANREGGYNPVRGDKLLPLQRTF